MTNVKELPIITVYPTKENATKFLIHPQYGPLSEDGSNWPNDSFTKRRLADGSISKEAPKAQKSKSNSNSDTDKDTAKDTSKDASTSSSLSTSPVAPASPTASTTKTDSK